MVESLIKLLIGIAIVVGLFFLVLWVLASLHIAVPEMVVVVIKVVGVLICILLLYRWAKANWPNAVP